MSAGEVAETLNLNLNTIGSALRRIPGLVMRTAAEAGSIKSKRGRCKNPCYWQGKKQPAAMVEKRISKIRGENHYLWKGGESLRPYRDQVVRDKCLRCGSRLNLCVHHIDFDYYNNVPENLAVLCNSCHLSLHKTMYWAAIHAGLQPSHSTGRCHWTKKYWKRWRKTHAAYCQEKYRAWVAKQKVQKVML